MDSLDGTSLLSTQAMRHRRREVPLHVVPYIPVAVGVLTITTTVTLFWVKGNGRPPSPAFWWPSVSRTGAEYPEIIFFSIGLHLIAFLAGFLGWAVWAVNERRLHIPNPPRGARRVNLLMLLTMAVFVVTCTATGSVSLSYDKNIHGFFAGVMFMFGTLYLVLNALLMHLGRSVFVRTDRDRFWFRYKAAVSSFTLVTVLVYVIVLGPFQVRSKDATGAIDPATGKVHNCIGTNHYCPVRNVRNVIEYFLIGALNIFFISLSHDLKGFHCAIIHSQSDEY